MRRSTSLAGPGRHVIGFALTGALMLMGGCVTRDVQEPSPPAPPLQLLDAGRFEIPRGCEPAHGAVYRTRYRVQPDGRVVDAASESGDGCVQDALRRWVSTYEYRPPGESTSTVIDWIAVTASRGG
jgi:hypothetical protein